MERKERRGKLNNEKEMEKWQKIRKISKENEGGTNKNQTHKIKDEIVSEERNLHVLINEDKENKKHTLIAKPEEPSLPDYKLSEPNKWPKEKLKNIQSNLPTMFAISLKLIMIKKKSLLFKFTFKFSSLKVHYKKNKQKRN